MFRLLLPLRLCPCFRHFFDLSVLAVVRIAFCFVPFTFSFFSYVCVSQLFALCPFPIWGVFGVDGSIFLGILHLFYFWCTGPPIYTSALLLGSLPGVLSIISVYEILLIYGPLCFSYRFCALPYQSHYTLFLLYFHDAVVFLCAIHAAVSSDHCAAGTFTRPALLLLCTGWNFGTRLTRGTTN